MVARLKAAAEASSDYDVAPFVTVYREIDWSERPAPAEDYVRAVRLALNTGAHEDARKMKVWLVDAGHPLCYHNQSFRLGISRTFCYFCQQKVR